MWWFTSLPQPEGMKLYRDMKSVIFIRGVFLPNITLFFTHLASILQYSVKNVNTGKQNSFRLSSCSFLTFPDLFVRNIKSQELKMSLKHTFTSPSHLIFKKMSPLYYYLLYLFFGIIYWYKTIKQK